MLVGYISGSAHSASLPFRKISDVLNESCFESAFTGLTHGPFGGKRSLVAMECKRQVLSGRGRLLQALELVGIDKIPQG